jgi:ActR/RegA family two-component response regulator
MPLPATQPIQEISTSPVHARGGFLVMDDEALVRDVLKKMFNLLGYKADCVASGQDAIAMYKKSFQMRVPVQADHQFRFKSITDSGAW